LHHNLSVVHWRKYKPGGGTILGGAQDLLHPGCDKEEHRGDQVMFETIPLRCSAATRREFRSQRSVMAKKGRNRAPKAA
jgi:hypothetical protein